MASLVTTTDHAKASDPATVLEQVSEAVRNYCGWNINQEPFTFTLDGSGTAHLWLPTLHLTEVTAVTNDGVELDEGEYDWSESGFIELRTGCWSPRPRRVVVTGTHGYRMVPQEIVGLISTVAARKVAAPAGVSRQSVGAVSQDFTSASDGSVGGITLFQTELDLLAKYKLPDRVA